MPDLGQYSFEVIASYLSALVLIGGLIIFSIRRQKRIRNEIKILRGE